jgi:hypothetical protein
MMASAGYSAAIFFMVIGGSLWLLGFYFTAQAAARKDVTTSHGRAEGLIAESHVMRARAQAWQVAKTDMVEQITLLKRRIAVVEGRLPRMRQGVRVVVEHGHRHGRSRRFLGHATNRYVGQSFRPPHLAHIGEFWAKEVQILIWADNLDQARKLFEEVYTSRVGYEAVFTGAVESDPPLPPLDGPPLDGPPLDGPPLDGPPLDGRPLNALSGQAAG